MAWLVIVKPEAKKDIERIPEPYKSRIYSALKTLEADPLFGDKLGGQLWNHYSVRVWPYRIIYRIYKEQIIVIVVRIRHRKDAYK